MILLLTSSSDVSVDYVITWLKILKHPYFRLNTDEIIEDSFFVNINKKTICFKEQNIPLEQIGVVWLRKYSWFSRSKYYHSVKKWIKPEDLRQITNEYGSILQTLVYLLKDKKWLTHPYSANLNKINMLLLAKKLDIDVPDSYIVSTKKQLLELIENGKEYISKSVYEPYFIQEENGVFSMFTKKIEDCQNLPDKFFPSFVQEKIDKEYELRTFFIDGFFFTMAIFSQSNEETKLDFRKSDWENPNRRIPYQLPMHIEKKLTKMLNVLSLNCCSIDIIRAKNGKYYFLEINPVGEFGMTSIPCNYEIYKKIASTLIKMDSR